MIHQNIYDIKEMEIKNGGEIYPERGKKVEEKEASSFIINKYCSYITYMFNRLAHKENIISI